VRRSVVGVVVAALLVPAGLIMVLRVVNPRTTSLILQRQWQGFGTAQNWLPYEAIPIRLRQLAIAAEDLRFCTERTGFDWAAIATQLAVSRDGGRPTGASTLTMQTARTLFLWPHRDWFRKLLEAWLTPQIALLWPRRRVLEVYLNVAEFGPGIYGVAAAAKAFWGRPVGMLRLDEAALLMTVLPAPDEWSVTAPTPAMTLRARGLAALVTAQDYRLDCAR
jgi:monofunctional biosynthetic peptidoglycan transglycosylase